MFFSKKTDETPVGHFDAHDDVTKFLLSLSNKDIGYLQKIGPVIKENLDEITDAFYAKITGVPEILSFIKKHSTVEQLKKTFRMFLVMLSETHIDKAYIDQIYKIGEVHNQIKLPVEWFSMSFGVLEQIVIPYVFAAYEKNPKELCRIIMALSQQTQYIQAIVTHTFIREYVADLKHKIEVEEEMLGKRNKLLSDIEDLSQSLAATAEEMTSSSEQMSDNVVKIKTSADNVKEKSNQTKTLASTGEEMIKKIIEELHMLTEQAATVKNNLEKLNVVSNSVSNITDTISNISSQTNLLALNAAIEAARAGSYGRGFAVVADEVRKLAEQSDQSADKIHELILKNTESTTDVANSMEKQNEVLLRIVDAIMHSGRQITKISEATNENYEQIESIDVALGVLTSTAKDIEQVSGNVAESATVLFDTLTNA